MRARAAGRGRRGAAARRRPRPRPWPPSTGHGGGNPFYLQQLWGARARPGARGGQRRGRRGSPACPPAVAASLAEELESLAPGHRARSSRRRRSPASRSSPTWRPRSGKAGDTAPAWRRSTTCSGLDLVRPTEVPRRFNVPPSPSCGGPCTRPRRGGTRLAAHARAAEALRRARRRSRPSGAHHVEQSARPAATSQAIALLLEAGARHGAARAQRGRALVRARRSGCCRRGDVERRVDVRVALASAQRSLGELDRCRATLLEAIELLPPDAVAPARGADRPLCRGRALGSAATTTPTGA